MWEGAQAAQQARRYTEMWGIEATVLLDEDAQYARSLGIRGVPTNVFVDAEGIVRAVGASALTELEEQLRRLSPEAGKMLHGEAVVTDLAGEHDQRRGPLHPSET